MLGQMKFHYYALALERIRNTSKNEFLITFKNYLMLYFILNFDFDRPKIW